MREPAPSFLPPYWDAAAPRPRFGMGRRVRVKTGAPPGHVRTPWYVRGKSGVVERVVGHFADPQELAYRRSGLPKLPLYRVRFALADVWRGHDVAPDAFALEDTLDVEIFETWLEPFYDYAAEPAAEQARLERLADQGRL